MSRPVRIAICQFASESPAEGSIESNFAKLESFVSAAASESANLIVFPEYFLTGVPKTSFRLHLQFISKLRKVLYLNIYISPARKAIGCMIYKHSQSDTALT